MAFIAGLDVYDPKKLGEDGSAVIGAERHIYYSTEADLTEFNPADSNSSWRRIYHIESYDATDKTNSIEVFDGKVQTETKEGKISSELKVAQTFKGWLNSIGRLKGKQLWFAECLTDERNPVDANGNPVYYEVRFVQGKFTSIEEEKGDAEAIYKITGSGSYTVDSQRKVFLGITPVTPTLTATGGNTATAGSPKTFTVTAVDMVGSNVVLTDLSVDTLLEEVTAVTLEKVSGTPTLAIASGANDATKSVTFTGTGVVVVKPKIVTANGGTFYGASVNITVS